MEDEKILQLYLDRNELAIHESAEKYGAYCRAVAMNILGDPDDAEGLADLMMAAFNQAADELEAESQKRLNTITGGVKLPF